MVIRIDAFFSTDFRYFEYKSGQSVWNALVSNDLPVVAGVTEARSRPAQLAEKAKEYEALQSNVVTAAKRGYVDLIIEPADTRKYLVAAFEMLFTKRMDTPYKKHGTKQKGESYEEKIVDACMCLSACIFCYGLW